MGWGGRQGHPLRHRGRLSPGEQVVWLYATTQVTWADVCPWELRVTGARRGGVYLPDRRDLAPKKRQELHERV